MVTIGKLNKDRTEKLLKASQYIEDKKQKYLIAITFAGIDEDATKVIRDNNIFVLTKNELLQIDNRLNTHIFS